jgi:hypothetical protein
VSDILKPPPSSIDRALAIGWLTTAVHVKFTEAGPALFA